MASMVAEVFITAMYLWLCRSYVRPAMLVRYGWKRLIAALIMLASVIFLGKFLRTGPVATALQIVAGAAVYFAALLALGDRLLLNQGLRMLKRLFP